MPLKEGTYAVSDTFGSRGGAHVGVDYAANLGTPIYAVADGFIVEGADRAPGSVGGFGNWVWQDSQTEFGKDFIYGHMRHADIYVRGGDRVKAGQLIARVGSEGGSSGPHLHLEVWTTPGRLGGRAVDPQAWLREAIQPATTIVTPAQSPKGGSMLKDPTTRAQISPHRHSGGRNVTWIAIHTQQGRSSAAGLTSYLCNPASEVSYNAVTDDRETVLVVPWDQNPWSASNANNRADHICLAGSFAEWSRGKWLEKDSSDGVNEDLMLTRTAALVAWRCQQRGIPIEYVGGGSIPPNRPGICGHRDFGQWGGGHTDPGPHFPWDELIYRAKQFAGGLDMQLTDKLVNFEGKNVDLATIFFWLDKRAYQNEVMMMAILDQLVGPGAGRIIRDQSGEAFKMWPQNGGRTPNDLLAAVAAIENVPGAHDVKEKESATKDVKK